MHGFFGDAWRFSILCGRPRLKPIDPRGWIKAISVSLLLSVLAQPASAQSCADYILELRDWDWGNGWISEDDDSGISVANAWYDTDGDSDLFAGALMINPLVGSAEAKARFEHTYEHTGVGGYHWIEGEFVLDASGFYEGGTATWYKLTVTIEDTTDADPVKVYDEVILQKTLSVSDLVWWEDNKTVRFSLTTPFTPFNSKTYRIRVTATAKVSAVFALGRKGLRRLRTGQHLRESRFLGVQHLAAG
jgi:hypothetical protein